MKIFIRMKKIILLFYFCAFMISGSAQDFFIDDGVLLRYTGQGGTVNIPDEVTKIAAYAFNDCTNVISVTIPNSVTEIGLGAFLLCIYNHRTTKTNQKYPSVNL